MMSIQGDPFHAEIHSADASSGVAIPIYKAGKKTAHTLLASEYLEIHSAEVVTAAGGDAYVLVGVDAVLGTAETIVRGTYAANGGIAQQLVPPITGGAKHTLWVVAPAGVVDVVVRGTIRKCGDGTSVRPTWRETKQ